jgi:hypothetical protein
MRRVTLAAAALLLISACDGQILGPERAFSPDRPLLSSQSDDGYLVTTGTHDESSFDFFTELKADPNGNGNSFQYLAGQFTLETGGATEAVEAFLWVNDPGALSVLIRADEGGLPGAVLASETFSVSTTSSSEWVLLGDLEAELSAGTYWLALEPVTGGGFWGAMQSGAETPLADYAFRNQDSGGWASLASNGDNPGFGMRISGIPGDDDVESPTSGSAPEELKQLSEEVESLDIHPGARNSLTALLKNAIQHYEDGRVEAACAMLVAAEQQLESQSGRQVPAATAADLKARVEEVRVLIEC